MTTRERTSTGVLPIVAAAVLWGTGGAVSTAAPAGAAPIAVGAAGLALGGLLLLVTAPRPLALPTGSRERLLVVVGGVAVAGYPLAYYPAVAATGVATATVVALGAAPLFTGLIAALTRRAAPTRRWVLATAAAIAGCAMLVLGADAADAAPLGILLAAAGSLSYAVYASAAARLVAAGHDSRTVMGQFFGGAALLTAPVAIVSGADWLTRPSGLLVATHLAVLVTFLAYRLFGHGLRRTPATTAATLTLVEPAVAALLGVLALGERLPTVSWVGMAMLIGSLLVLSVPGGRPARSTSTPAGGHES